MPNTVKPIPAGYEQVTPYICCQNATAALEFYKKAFGAVEFLRLNGPNNSIAHVEFKIGKAIVMMSEECPDMNWKSPASLGGSPVCLLIYVLDVDGFVAKAIAAGAKVLSPTADQFYGDRSCKLADPFGHVWMFATHIEDVPQDEIERRCAKLFEKP